MTAFKNLDQLDLAGKRVLLRVDLNVPMKEGRITDTTRIDRVLPTIKELTDGQAVVVLLSHFGRPKGTRQDSLSLAPLLPALQSALPGRQVAFVSDCIGPQAQAAVQQAAAGSVVLLENLRFHRGEEANDPAFAGELAVLGDLYVNDAFSAAHRAHASVEAITALLPSAAGRAMETELRHLAAALEQPKRPLAALVGGAKISTKLDLLGNLVSRVDLLIIGGGMANTFLNAQGISVGASLCEHDMADTAREILAKAEKADCEILLPKDVVVAAEVKAHTDSQVVPADQVPAKMMILDCGPEMAADLNRRLQAMETLVWNGPLGCFEVPPFDAATRSVAQAAADLTDQGRLLTVAGGGDTVSALTQCGVADRFSYISTAGGAFLEWLEGKTLPGVAALSKG
ncbi:MAG: phosphoglycerate kinase [Pseudomonadota bacterium]